MLLVVFLMLSPAALLVSWPTTAEPVTASSRPAGAAGRSVFSQSRIRSTAMRVLFERWVPFSRAIVSTACSLAVGARADQARTDDRRAMRVELPDPQLRVRLAELVKLVATFSM